MEQLDLEMKKDQKEIENNKIKLINEIKTLDKNKMFTPKPKKSFFEKLSIVLGFGKKR